MRREREKFYVERDSFGAEACAILLGLSVAFRLIGCWGLWSDRTYLITQIALPVCSALLMILLVWLLGKRALWTTMLPLVMGIAFFIIKATTFESRVHMILCILLYLLIAAVWFCTVFGYLRSKWLLAACFGLPFLYHIFVEDLSAMRDTGNPVSFADGMQEMGVLCIMLGLFFLTLSMKKREREPNAQLPKIRPPRVLRPGREPAPEQEDGKDEVLTVDSDNGQEIDAGNKEQKAYPERDASAEAAWQSEENSIS